MKPKTLAYIQLGLLALGVGLFLWWAYPQEVAVTPEVQLTEAIDATTTNPVFSVSEIQAKSVFIYDTVNQEIIYDKNGELQLPLASLTKVMTALAVSDLLPNKDIVRITQDDLIEEGDSGLVPNEEWSVKDLLDFSLIVSSNDGARALASVAGAFLTVDPANATSSAVTMFVREMNKTARRIGLEETYFLNPSGLDMSPTLSGGYGSARDMAILFEHIIENKPHLLEATSFDRLSVPSKLAQHDAVNTNKAINMIPNVIGSKTGFTDLSGGNLVVAFDAGIGHPIIVAVLGSTYDGRFDDMARLVDSTIEYLAQK